MSLHSKVMSAWRLPRQFVNPPQTSWEWRSARHAAKRRCSLLTGLLRKFFTTLQQQSWSISHASSAGMCAAIICCHAHPLRGSVPHVPNVYVRRLKKNAVEINVHFWTHQFAVPLQMFPLCSGLNCRFRVATLQRFDFKSMWRADGHIM